MSEEAHRRKISPTVELEWDTKWMTCFIYIYIYIYVAKYICIDLYGYYFHMSGKTKESMAIQLACRVAKYLLATSPPTLRKFFGIILK